MKAVKGSLGAYSMPREGGIKGRGEGGGACNRETKAIKKKKERMLHHDVLLVMFDEWPLRLRQTILPILGKTTIKGRCACQCHASIASHFV